MKRSTENQVNCHSLLNFSTEKWTPGLFQMPISLQLSIMDQMMLLQAALNGFPEKLYHELHMPPPECFDWGQPPEGSRWETLLSRRPIGSKSPACCPVAGHHGDGYMLVTHPSCTLGAPTKPAKVLSQCLKGHFCPHHLSHQAFGNCTLLYVYKRLSQAPSYLRLTNLPVRWSQQELLSPFCK